MFQQRAEGEKTKRGHKKKTGCSSKNYAKSECATLHQELAAEGHGIITKI